MRTTKVVAGVLAALLLGTLTISAGVSDASAQSGQPATYRVEYTNITSGQYLTPPNYAAHEVWADVFEVGHAPSAGVAAVAENGDVPALAAELNAAIDQQGLGVSGVGDPDAGPIGPGQTRTFEFTTNQTRLSVVSMVVCTNDAFAGLDSKRLPRRDGQTKTFNLRAYDAGAELNTELRADLVPAPFCGPGDGNPNSDPSIDGQNVITRHRTLRGVGDLPDSFDWRGPVAQLTVTRIDAPAVPTNYSVTVQNITNGQYLTPPNYAAHGRSADVFQVGAAPSPGVAAVAENGAVPVLAAELNAAIDQRGLGVSGVGDPDAGPIAPGDTRTFSFATTENRLSVVSMIVCTNDGFAGLDSKRLPQWAGESTTYYLRAFDAGAELNTELRADLVPAPFCGPGDGNPNSDPSIDGQNVITRHRTLRGVGDLPDSFDWRGPVMAVTVTNNG